jgi:hypothetical protein
LEITKKEIQVLISLFLGLGITFLVFQHKAIYDEDFHLIEIQNFFKNGLNSQSLSQYATESGIFAHFIASRFIYLIPNALLAARLSSFLFLSVFSWFFLFKVKENQAYYFAFLFFISNYISFHLGAIFLTETTAFCLAFISIYNLGKYLENPKIAFALISSICLGLAMISRFYLMALYPTILCFILIKAIFEKKSKGEILVSLFVFSSSIIFLAILVFQWEGITPPAFKIRYPEFDSGVGFGIIRPIISLLYVGIFALPIIVLSQRFKIKSYFKEILISIIITVIIYIYIPNLWDTSGIPNHSTGIVDFVLDAVRSISPIVYHIANFFFQFLGVMGLLIISKSIFEKFDFKSNKLLFSLLFMFFYTLEQAFVSGNVAYYERYLLLVYPFLGIIIFETFLNQKINIKIKTYLYVCIGFSILKLILDF